jgi:hypothetical protein
MPEKRAWNEACSDPCCVHRFLGFLPTLALTVAAAGCSWSMSTGSNPSSVACTKVGGVCQNSVLRCGPFVKVYDDESVQCPGEFTACCVPEDGGNVDGGDAQTIVAADATADAPADASTDAQRPDGGPVDIGAE